MHRVLSALAGLAIGLLLPLQAQKPVANSNKIVSALLQQFDKSDLVGLGEFHGSQADQDLRIGLVRHKDFPRKVRNIVIEFGNSLYQQDLDRYIRGEDTKRQAQRVWRDTTQIFAGNTILTVYEQFLSEVRAVNLHLPDNLKIRVLAADPPIDWAKVQSSREFMPFLEHRVEFAADLITREILRKHEKALLIFGAGHFYRHTQRRGPAGTAIPASSIASLIDEGFPGRLYTVTPVFGKVYPDTPALERMIRRNQRPVLIPLKGSTFASLNPNEFLAANASVLLGAPQNRAVPPFPERLGMADVVDACIYRGQTPDAIVPSAPSLANDQAYASELEQRARRASSQLAPADRSQVVVISHRGEHLHHPENTMPAFRAAVDAGADFIEVDVRTTADGRLVLMHDATVDRTTNGHGEVATQTLDAIRQLDAGIKFSPEFAGTKVPTFEEVLEFARGKIGVYIDAKRISASDLVAVVGKHGLDDHVVVYGSVSLHQEIQKLNPRIRVMPEAVSVEVATKLITELSPRVMAFDARDFKNEIIAVAKQAKAGIYVDRLGLADTPASWEDAVNRGATGIQSDHPAELVRFLREKGWRK